MSKVGDALDALRVAQELLDDLEEWAAAGHVSMATSLLYGAYDNYGDRSFKNVSQASASPELHHNTAAPLGSQATTAQGALSTAG